MHWTELGRIAESHLATFGSVLTMQACSSFKENLQRGNAPNCSNQNQRCHPVLVATLDISTLGLRSASVCGWGISSQWKTKRSGSNANARRTQSSSRNGSGFAWFLLRVSESPLNLFKSTVDICSRIHIGAKHWFRLPCWDKAWNNKNYKRYGKTLELITNKCFERI